MSKVAIKGNPLGTGTFTIEAPNSDTDSTVLLPVGGGSVVLTEAAQTLTNKSISASQVNSGTLDSARIPDLAATKITSGTFDAARIPSLDASKITTGTVATARLASGTANSTTFLRGDSTWQTINTTPPTDFDAVGTYVVAYYTANSLGIPGGGSTNYQILSRGATVAGSSLRVNSRSSGNFTNFSSQELQRFGPWASVSTNGSGTAFPTTNSVTLSGTWRFMAAGVFVVRDESGSSTWIPGLWVRIS